MKRGLQGGRASIWRRTSSVSFHGESMRNSRFYATSTPQNLIEKIVQHYTVCDLDNLHTRSNDVPSLIQVDVKGDKKVRSLDFVTIKPQHVMTHDNTSAVIKKFDAIGATRVKNKRQIVFTLDHNIQVRNNLDLNLVSFHLPLPNRTTGSN